MKMILALNYVTVWGIRTSERVGPFKFRHRSALTFWDVEGATQLHQPPNTKCKNLGSLCVMESPCQHAI